MTKLLSYSAYARHRGCSVEAVSKAVETGRISTMMGKRGLKQIDPVVADREWAANTDPMMQRGAQPELPLMPSDEELEADDDTGDDEAPILALSKARKEHYLAKMSKLKYEHQSGILVPVDDVKKAAFEMGRILRESILGIPDRISGELAGETEAHAVHVRLTRELTQALDELTRGA